MKAIALEITQGRSASVMPTIRPYLSHAAMLPHYSWLLGTDVWVAWVDDETDSSAFVGGDILNVEGTVNHIFYAMPPFAEATRPGIGDLSPEDIADLLKPFAENVDVASLLPFGSETLSLGPGASLDDLGSDGKWNQTLDMIQAPKAWEKSQGGNSIIAVLDSGIDGSRFDERQLAGAWSDSPQEENPLEDTVGHGTMTSMLAVANPAVQGFAGVAPQAKLFVLNPMPGPTKVISTAGIMMGHDYILGVARQMNKRIIVSNSWGIFGCKPIFLPCRIIETRALVAMDNLGLCIHTWAVGNNHLENCGTQVEAWCMNTTPTSVAAGAMTLSGQRQDYSAIGGQCYPPTPTVATPTEGVLPWGDGFRDFGRQGGGTSACAPQVAGALAILDTLYPTATNAQLRAALRSGAKQIGPDPQHNLGIGAGMLQIDDAITALPSAESHWSYAYEKTFLESKSTLV